MSDDEHNDGYKPGEKVDLETLKNQDADDESLRKYKEALLGNMSATFSPKDDPRRVVITQLKIIIDGRDPIVYALDSAASIKELKSKPFILKVRFDSYSLDQSPMCPIIDSIILIHHFSFFCRRAASTRLKCHSACSTRLCRVFASPPRCTRDPSRCLLTRTCWDRTAPRKSLMSALLLAVDGRNVRLVPWRVVDSRFEFR